MVSFRKFKCTFASKLGRYDVIMMITKVQLTDLLN